MTIILRHRQVGITRVSPHPGNRKYAIPGGLRGLEAGYPDDATYYNGVDEYIHRSSGLLGIVATKQAIFSCWIRLDSGADGIVQRVFDHQFRMRIFVSGAGAMLCEFSDLGNTLIARVFTANVGVADGVFHHFIAALDLNNLVAKGYWDGSAAQITVDNVANEFLDYTRISSTIGAGTDGANSWTGCIGEFYYNTKEYVDLDDPAELGKFISPDLFPVDLGANGEIPTGSQPTIYFKDGGRDGINLGDGGDFTVIGTPVKCTIPGPQV